MHTVISAFDDRAQAQRAMERLIERGFSRDMVHLQSGPAGSTSASASGTQMGSTTYHEEHHGFFSGIADFFSELFGPDDTRGEARHYAEAVRRGSTVLVVDAADEQEAERAREVMTELGGTIDMDERTSQWRSEGWTGFDPSTGSGSSQQPAGTTGAYAGGAATLANVEGDRNTVSDVTREGTLTDSTSDRRGLSETAGQEAVMPVVQEELQIGKRQVERGGIRVIQRVSETPVKEMIRLREERAVVERRPVDRPATEADFANFREGTIEIRETAEEAVVGKTARVVEEVVVGKEVQERTETVADTVRRTDVEVEQLAGQRSSAAGTGSTSGLTESIPDDEITSRTK
jgi:uncharacterized protein (TIGR02271 family)